MTNQTLKAYEVHDGDEGWAIVFATNGATARRLGAGELSVSFEEVEFCRRMPAVDQYAPGPVPPLALIDLGWWFECYGCGRIVNDDVTDDQGRPLTPVADGQEVYCCAGCRAKNRAATVRRCKVEADTIDAMVGMVLARYPNATITGQHVHAVDRDGWAEVKQASIAFTFPGSRYGSAEICYDITKGRHCDTHILYDLRVAHGDLAAWEAWLDAGCPAEMPATLAA